MRRRVETKVASPVTIASLARLRVFGMIYGYGPSVEKAVQNLYSHAKQKADEISGASRSGWETEFSRRDVRGPIIANYTIEGTRLAFYSAEPSGAWLAYGTLVIQSVAPPE